MKYLEKSFSLPVTTLPYKGKRNLRDAEPMRPKEGHEFVDVGGICRGCGLDRQGHAFKWSKLKT
jgi:hypothetical protein